MEYTKDRNRDFLKAYRREMRRAWERKETIESQELIRRAIEVVRRDFMSGLNVPAGESRRDCDADCATDIENR